MAASTNEFQDKSKEIVNKLDCKLEKWEQEKIIDLGKELEKMKDQDQTKDILKINVKTLWEQKMWNSDKTLKDFLEKDIKSVLEKKKAEWDAASNSSTDYDAVQKFKNKIGTELTTICWNGKTDKVMWLQIYLNALNDIAGKHATIPYTAKSYEDYKEGEEKRLFVDGYLGPHTYNALWLALFGQELPKTNITRKSWYDFERNKPRIINKDLPYIPLTLPKIDKTWKIESQKSIEIIDDPKIKWSIELLYLFYDWLAKKNDLKVDIDNEILKIMSDPNLRDNKNEFANPLDGYMKAIKELNIKLAGNNPDYKKWRDYITGFINIDTPISESEFNILSTLEYDIGVHEYVANYIAAKSIDLTKEPYKTKIDTIKTNTADKNYEEYEKEIDKKWIEQKAVQKKFVLDTFNTAKKNAQTPEQKTELCQMFWVSTFEEVTAWLIAEKTEKAISLAEGDFKSRMSDIYFSKRFLEEKIRSDKANLDWLGNYAWKDKLYTLFGDIQWLGWLNPSSENLDTTKFIAQMIAEEAACFAIWAVTAGAGTLILNSALYGRRAIKIARLARAVNRWATVERKISKFNQLKNIVRTVNLAEKTVKAERSLSWAGKVINATTFAAKIGVEWVWFYQASNAFQNIFDGKSTFEWWDNLPENIKSIAMMWALRAVNWLVATKKIVSLWWKAYNINPFNTLATKNTDKIFTKAVKIWWESLVGWTAIFAVEHTWDMLIEQDPQHPWTKEEFIQAVLMYMVFRWIWEAGKLKITKNKKTLQPEIQKELPPHLEPKELPLHPEPKELSPHPELKELLPNRIKEIEAQLKPINDRLAELNKSWEYNMPEGQQLRQEKAKLTLERNRLLDSQKKIETQKKVVEKKLTPEQKIKARKIEELQTEIEWQKNELSVAREKYKTAMEKWNTKMEKILGQNIFYREQDIKFLQAQLNKLQESNI